MLRPNDGLKKINLKYLTEKSFNPQFTNIREIN